MADPLTADHGPPNMDHIKHLQCLICAKQYAPDEVDYVCPDHGNEGIVDVCYDYGLIATRIGPETLGQNPDTTIWRYKPLLPVQPDAPVPPLAVGWTPLYTAPRLADSLGLRHLWIKDDGRQPTASFKDRASAVAVVKAQEKGAEIITTASTGNAAAALSGLCASVAQANVIFVPESAPPAKIAQLLAFGSTVMLVDGTYDDAFELCLQAADAYGWYNRNTAFNPYMTEGKKTVSYEICEQLTMEDASGNASPLHWEAPDAIFVSVGDGCIIGGVHKGLKDLLALGWISHMPRIYGVQAAGSNYLAEAWENDEDVLTKPPIDAHTVADSISAGLPRDRIKAMAAVCETGGAYITVSDDEILTAIPTLARGVGVFAEPAGAAAYAGLVKAVGQDMVQPNDRIVVVNTGNGLKDIKSAMKSVEMVGTEPHRVEATMDAVKAVLVTADHGPPTAESPCR
ncbi:MAG: threonine synthase [Chloroflexota bacterium]|nr:threonine synthase [Chloroflexota bacterium]